MVQIPSKSVKGFRSCMASKFALALDLAVGLYNSSYYRNYRTSRDAKIWPPPPLSPLTDRHLNLHRRLSGTPAILAKFYQYRWRSFASAHQRLFGLNCLLGYAKMCDITRFYAEMFISGSRNQNLTLVLLCIKNAILWCDFDGTEIVARKPL